MNRRKRKKIIILVSAIFGSIILIFGFFIFNVLGPFRMFFWNLPSVLGFFGPKTYLVLLQNNNELRPTGGFITAIAEVNIFFSFPRLEIMDSYQVPDPSPKLPALEPFEYFIGKNDPNFSGFTFRDANFSPDFRQTSKSVIDLYQKAFPGKKIDGVIGIDFTVIEELLKIFGPITFEGQTFDADHFFIESQRLSKDIDIHNIEELQQRKNTLKPLALELKSRIFRSPFRYREVFEKLYELAMEKHILFQSQSPSLEAKIEQFKLTMVISPFDPSEDGLYINIANIGGRKADRYVSKTAKYRIDFSSSPLRSYLNLELEHLGTYNIQSDFYQAYVRIYTPAGTKFISSSASPLRSTQIFSEFGLNVFADYIRLKPGEKIQLSYQYELPSSVDSHRYRFHFIKQPGLTDQYFRFAIQKPNEVSMKNNAEATPIIIKENVGTWQGVTREDLFFAVDEEADTEGPMIMWQEFTNLKLINIRFQEELEKEEAETITNYDIVDTNEINPEVTDSITIIKAMFENRDLWLTIEGATPQQEERYWLTIRDLKDKNENRINPNPLSRTLIQRIKP